MRSYFLGSIPETVDALSAICICLTQLLFVVLCRRFGRLPAVATKNESKMVARQGRPAGVRIHGRVRSISRMVSQCHAQNGDLHVTCVGLD